MFDWSFYVGGLLKARISTHIPARGGKVASLLALTDPSLLSSLIIEDTAPAPAPPEGAEQNMHYVELMERINELSLDDKRADLERKQVDAMLLEMGVEVPRLRLQCG